MEAIARQPSNFSQASLPLECNSNLNPSERAELVQSLRDAYRLAVLHSSRSLEGMLQHVVIDSRPEPKAFRLVADPWQWTMNRRMAPAIEAVMGLRNNYTGPRRFWWTLPRGHDKTSAQGRICSAALGFSKRQLNIVGAAGDQDQANYLASYMEAEAKLNPWLYDRLTFQKYKVLGQHGSKLEIFAADAPSSFGNKSDIIILDEVTHWQDQSLWGALLTSIEKRPDSVLIVITNAGLLRSWQHDAMLSARTDPDWMVYEAPGPIASWMNAERIARIAQKIPRTMAQRVLYNKWQDASEGCNFIQRIQADACVLLGISRGLSQKLEGAAGVEYVCGVDYAPVKDRTVMTVLHLADDGVLEIDRMDVYQGSPGSRMSIQAVEEWMMNIHGSFHRPKFIVDPHQMEASIQKLGSQGLNIERFETRGGKANYDLANNLHTLIANKKCAWPAGMGDLVTSKGTLHTFVDELCELIIKPMSYGYRIDHEASGHDDRAVGVGMAALAAVKNTRRALVWNEGYF